MMNKKNNKTQFSGIIPPTVTPLQENETLDLQATQKLVEHCIAGGVSGLFVNGTSGEALRVSNSVWEQNMQCVLHQANGRIPIFCGAIDTSTAGAIERIQRIEDAGGEIAVCTPPFYLTSFGQDEIYRHYDKICNSTNIMIAIYNIPETTHANILPETVAKLAEYENIIAYKDSTADWQQLQRAMMLVDNTDIAVFNGAEELCAVSMLYGADGCIPGLANFIPQLFVQLRTLCMAGKIAESYQLQRQINSIRKSIFVNGCWMSGMKGLLKIFGIGNEHVSSPLQPITQKHKEEATDILQKCNISFG